MKSATVTPPPETPVPGGENMDVEQDLLNSTAPAQAELQNIPIQSVQHLK